MLTLRDSKSNHRGGARTEVETTTEATEGVKNGTWVTLNYQDMGYSW